MTKFVVYDGDEELLVTTKKLEPEFLKLHFGPGNRDLDDYDRTEFGKNEVGFHIGVSNVIRFSA